MKADGSTELEVAAPPPPASTAKSTRAGSDARSVAALVAAHVPFVAKVAQEYRRYGISFEDLIQEGNVGLVEAAHRYDPSRGVKFFTYASWWIRKAIIESLGRHGALVRLPGYQVRRLKALNDAERAFRAEHGRQPGLDELSRCMSAGSGTIASLRQIGRREIALETSAGTRGSFSLVQTLAAPAVESPEAPMMREESVQLVRRALAVLKPRERLIVVRRYGLDDGRRRSLDEAGAELGVSRERVRQIERQALDRLRRIVTAQSQSSAPSRRPKPLPPLQLAGAAASPARREADSTGI